MQTTINLQEPFTYSVIPFIISACFTVAMTIYYIYNKKTKKEIIGNQIKVISEKNIKNVTAIKKIYINKLNEIESQYNNQKLELRRAYQLISEVIRLFVFEVTDITTQNYSLIEIKQLNIPNLYELIKEYYEPEFASKSVGDFNTSIEKARRVIKQWN